jgi:hypothetical protein
LSIVVRQRAGLVEPLTPDPIPGFWTPPPTPLALPLTLGGVGFVTPSLGPTEPAGLVVLLLKPAPPLAGALGSVAIEPPMPAPAFPGVLPLIAPLPVVPNELVLPPLVEPAPIPVLPLVPAPLLAPPALPPVPPPCAKANGATADVIAKIATVANNRFMVVIPPK